MALEYIIIAGAAVLADYTLGDPRNRYHPTAWMGRLVARLTMLVRSGNPAMQKAAGVGIIISGAVLVLAALGGLFFGISLIPDTVISAAVAMLASIILFKTTFAIRGMQQHALAVMESLDDMHAARQHLAKIVKRDTDSLDQRQVISATLESIGENTVDGITGPMFYFALAGLPGALVYRLINTADSMIGYKNKTFRHVGWFAASADTVVNYIPSRLTGCVMVLSSAILQGNWRESYKVMRQDSRKASSCNSGYAMAALAGALDTRLQKAGHYELGRGNTGLEAHHIKAALSIMKVTSVLFFGTILVPIILGWWYLA